MKQPPFVVNDDCEGEDDGIKSHKNKQINWLSLAYKYLSAPVKKEINNHKHKKYVRLKQENVYRNRNQTGMQMRTLLVPQILKQ